jgi:UDP-N-acetylmuramyl tripeptide synthase
MTRHRPAGGRHAAAPGRPGRRIASSPMGKLPLRARLATSIGGAAGRMSRLAGRGDGSVIGGVIGLRVEPDLLALLAAGRRVVLVTGTNGKTTTTRLITAALGALGQEVASNAFGANMEAGLAAALGQAPDAPLAVLETDEKYLPTVLAATRARAVALLNLSRDQMDRAAEIWMVARRWREALASATNCTVVANADDPLIAWAAAAAPDVIWVAAGQRWHEDSWCCPQCGSHLTRDELGWRCGECEFTRPPARWVLDGSSVIDSAGRVHEVSLSLPGQANRSNAVIALAVSEVFGVEPAQALARLRDVASVAGRYTQVERHGRQVRLLLAKNPAGWLEAFDVLDEPPVPVLLSVNAREPDGRDTSWLWDVDYRVLRGRPVFVTGERRLDLAVRLEADLVPFELVEGVDDAVDRVSGGRLDVIANYTAFQQIRVLLGRAA